MDSVGTTSVNNATASWSVWTNRNDNVPDTGAYENIISEDNGTLIRGIYHTTSGATTNQITFFHIWSGSSPEWETNAGTSQAWHHIGVTYNRGATTNDPVIYIDGTSVAFTEITAPSGTANTGQNNLRLGEDIGGADDFDGTIAHVAIWNVILAAGEMQALSRGVSPFRIRPGNLVHYLPLYGRSAEQDLRAAGVTYTVTGTTIVAGPPRVQPPFAGYEGWPGAFTAAGAPPAGWAHLLSSTRNRLVYVQR